MTVSLADLKNLTNIKAVFAAGSAVDQDVLLGPCTVWAIRCDQKAETYTAKLFNNKAPTMGSTAADAWITVANGAGQVRRNFGKKGLKFPTGLSLMATDLPSTASATLTLATATFYVVVSPGV